MERRGLRSWRAELHVHTVGSPCAEIEMVPPLIVERALALGLDLLAVTDHNSAENAGAVMAAARGSRLSVLPGMELQTREEVHLLCLFGALDAALAWQETVYEALPARRNDPRAFGVQLVVDAAGELLRVNERLLLTSAALSVEEAVAGVAELGGLVLAAHVDRPSFSLLANLGFVPEGLALAGLELTPRASTGWAEAHGLAGWPLVRSGDAHRLEEIMGLTTLLLAKPSIPEIRMALAGRAGRRAILA